MRKRIWAMTMVAVLALSLVAIGCPPVEQVQPPVGVEPIDPIVWIGQTRVPSGNPYWYSALRVAERITTASGGRLVLELYPAGAIVPAAEEFLGVHKGIIDWGDTCYMFLKHLYPSAALFTFVSGGMTPVEAYIWMSQAGGGALVREMLADYNVVLFDGGGNMAPPEVFLHTNVPIKTTECLSGLKVRAVGDGGEILARIGAGVVFMPVGEIFEAMMKGVIDAFEAASPAFNWALGLQEAARYLYLSPVRQPYEFNPFMVNRDRWNELPDDLKAIVEMAFREEAMTYYAKAIVEDLEALEKFEDFGVEIRMLPPEVEAAWIEAAVEHYEELAAECAFAARVIEHYKAFMEAYREVWGRGGSN